MSARTPTPADGPDAPIPDLGPVPKPSVIGWSASFAGLRPLTALTACAALSAFVDPALAQTPAQPHENARTATALMEVEAPMPPPHLEIANGNRRGGA